MNRDSKIYVAGHRGMVGSAIIRLLKEKGYSNIVCRSSHELDLRNQALVDDFFKIEKPEYVFLAAAKVGGILANNNNKASFFYDNSMIAQNVIHASYVNKTKKLLNLGSSCIYPKLANQPLKEEYLLTGALEETNDAYALAKIGAIMMCDYYNQNYGTDFISAMPTNLYGINDNYDLESSHVFPALIRKMHEAKKAGLSSVTLWGDGSPFREFLNADDLALALLFLMEQKNAVDVGRFINVGFGKEITIKALAELIAGEVGFTGSIEWDKSKPNGTPRKIMDSSRIKALGWTPNIELKEGIQLAYKDFLKNYN